MGCTHINNKQFRLWFHLLILLPTFSLFFLQNIKIGRKHFEWCVILAISKGSWIRCRKLVIIETVIVVMCFLHTSFIALNYVTYERMPLNAYCGNMATFWCKCLIITFKRLLMRTCLIHILPEKVWIKSHFYLNKVPHFYENDY